MPLREEEKEYQDSYLNPLIECSNTIKNGVESAIYDRTPDEFMQEMCNEYGYERVNLIVANHISRQIWDGRYDNSVKNWAKHQPSLKRLSSMSDKKYNSLCLQISLGNMHPIKINYIAHWVIDNEKNKESFVAPKLQTTAKDKLAECVDNELAAYEEWLITLPPKEILQHTYDHSVLCDIVFVIKEQDTVSEETAKKLLTSPNILADLKKDIDKLDININAEICSVIEERAEKSAAKSVEKSNSSGIDFEI